MSGITSAPPRPTLGHDVSVKSILKVDNNTDKEFTNSFDYVMVFGMLDPCDPLMDMIQSPEAKTAIYQMLEAGLEVFPYLSCQKDELYCLIRAPLEKLREFADVSDYPMAVSARDM
jgi:hypothetical protein